jgi:diguanylate cyclase (GGDEF)-like protein
MFTQFIDAAVPLDLSTLFVVAMCVAALLGLFLLYAGQQERVRALAWWGAAYLVGGFSVALWSLADEIVPPSLPSALLFLACGMIWSAARLFHGRPVMWVAMSAGALSWIAACSFPAFVSGGTQRAVAASLIVFAYVVLTAAELWRERRRNLIRRWPALFVPVLHGLVFLFPLPLASLLPSERGMLTLASGWIAVFVLEVILYVVGTAFIMLTLTREKTLTLHKTAALTDPMTGLYNRRGFDEGAGRVIAARTRRRQPVTALLFDLDHFKLINDRFGHATGDTTLKLFASVISTGMRSDDLIARLGGEEFAALIVGSLEDGVAAAERIRVAFETAARAVGGRYVGATVSVGVACGNPEEGVEALLDRADRALYDAKRNGRNRVATALDLIWVDAKSEQESDGGDAVQWTAYRRPVIALRPVAAHRPGMPVEATPSVRAIA